ncbi:MAG: carbohydrate porin [Lentisphaeraceae bacterium]|nr:carbohydrate porin [Lentisphaeraceae bacterium]
MDGDVSRYDGSGSDSSADGAYFVFDQNLYKENPNLKDDNQGIGMYLQYGFGDEDVQAIKDHYGAGLQWTGAFSNRDEDIVGIGYSSVGLSDEPNAGFSESRESAYELFYKAPLSPWLTVQGDAQYIENPGGQSRRDALVFTLRFTIKL